MLGAAMRTRLRLTGGPPHGRDHGSRGACRRDDPDDPDANDANDANDARDKFAEDPPMRIACLAWGSLIWKWAPLKLATPWQDDGPELPIEFARESDGGELATALSPGARDVPTHWALLADDDVAVACAQLKAREKIPAERHDGIGHVPGAAAGTFDARIAAWAQRRAIDAVVWTALPPRSHGVEGRMPSQQEAVAYLSGLRGDVRSHAEQYVRQVPPGIATAYRSAIETALGWTPRPADPA